MLPRVAEPFRKEEVARCEEFLRSANRLRCPPHLTVDQWVDRTFAMHSHLIERWGGLEYWAKPFTTEDAEANRPAFTKLYNELIFKIRENYDGYGRPKSEDVPPYFEASFQLIDNPVGTFGSEAFLQKNIPEELVLSGRAYKLSKKGCTMMVGVWRKEHAKLDKYGNMTNGFNTSVMGPVRPGERVSAAILRILDDTLEGKYPKLRAHYEWFVQQLGERVWVASTKSTVVGFSVRPSMFLRLGHLCEGSSCYQNGGQSDHSKLFLGADFPDSFVVLAHRDRDVNKVLADTKNTDKLSYKPHARGWGMAALSQGAFISNFYGLPLASLWSAIKEALPGAFDIQDPEKYNAVGQKQNQQQALGPLIAIGQMYLNNDGFYVGGNTEFRQRMASRWMENVSRYASTYGTYTRCGSGPAAGQADVPMPEEWPYREVDLKLLTQESKSWL